MAKKKNNNLWFVLGGIIIAVLIIWIIAANVNNDVICNAPHIKVGNSCCLDENSNGICDGDEEPKKLQTYCGDGICQSDEDYNSCSDDCEPSPSKMVGIRAFDYDKDEKRITILQIEDPNHYPDWTLNAKGYGSDGNLKFEKDVQMDCYGFYSDYYCSGVCTDCRVSDIPYLEGGTLSIKALSGDATVQAIGDYSYSTFDSEISFDVEFNSYDGDEDEFIYEITNTGKRIIIVDSIVGILFIDECGLTVL